MTLTGLRAGASRNRTVVAAVGAIAGLALLSALWLAQARSGGVTAVVVVDDLAELAAALAAAALSGFTASRLRGRLRVAWGMLGLAALSWALGEAAWSYQELILRQPPASLFPSWPDLGYLPAVPLAMAGLLTLPAAPLDRGGRIRLVLDGLTVAAALLFASYTLVLASVYQNADSGIWKHVLSVAYPAGDVAMGTVLIVVLARLPRGNRGPYVILGAGIACNALADTAFAYLTGPAAVNTTNPVDAGWTAGFAFIALAAWMARHHRAEAVDADEEVTSLGIVLPYIPVLFAGTVAVWAQLNHRPFDDFMVWSGLGLVGLVLARQALALVDNLILNRTLEVRVEVRTLEAIEHRARLRSSELRFSALVAHSSDVVTIIGAEHIIQYQSEALKNVLGYEPEALVGTDFIDLVHDDDRAEMQAALRKVVSTPDRVVTVSARLRNAVDDWRDTETQVRSLLFEPSVRGIVLNTRDVTERTRLESQLRHQAFHDSLTGLPNRALFQDRLDHEIARQGRGARRPLGVFVIDIDGFRATNDAYGAEFGDELLRLMGRRLAAAMRPGDTLARTGADEFAVLVEELDDDADAARLAQRLLDTIAEQFTVAGRTASISASIGIAISNGGDTRDAVMGYADLAAAKAHGGGKGTYEFFQPALQAAATNRIEMEGALKRALDIGELVLFYQPLMALASGRVAGLEALVRWRSPERGLVPPLEFIPLAEETGMIIELGRWALRTACADTSRLQRTVKGCENIGIAVNLSVRQLRAPGLIDDVREALLLSNLHPKYLTLEVTESLLMEDADEAIARLSALRALGVQIALDDFGTGFSSFSYLRDMPLDVIKIDRAFVRDVHQDRAATALTRSIVSLAETLELAVVAEGIEEREQLDQLVELGCGEGQGFYFSKPVPLEDVVSTIRRLHGEPDAARLRTVSSA